MALRKDSAADKEQLPPQDMLHRSNMGSAAGALFLGGLVARQLDNLAQVTLVLDADGYIRLVDPVRVQLRPPTEDELIEEMVAAGAEERQIIKALKRLKEWDKVPRKAKEEP